MREHLTFVFFKIKIIINQRGISIVVVRFLAKEMAPVRFRYPAQAIIK